MGMKNRQKFFCCEIIIIALMEKEDGTIDNAHLYGFVLIMRRLLQAEAFAVMKKEILRLTKKYPFVAMRYYGFRDDWQEKL